MKKMLFILLLSTIVFSASAFEKGWVLDLRADFSGSLTLPSIPLEDLKELNPLAKDMTGSLSSMLVGGQVAVGYIFDSKDIFPVLKEDSVFSGMAVKGYLAFGQGNTSQKIIAEDEDTGEALDIFIVVDYLPIINLGVETEALFFDNRLSIGLGVGARMIADFVPSYLAYSTSPIFAGDLTSEVGEIIVSEEMINSMNAFAFSSKLDLAYNIPLMPTTELVLGLFTQFNLYKPMALTVPASLAEMGGLDSSKPLPSPNYWLNSLDFGATLGFLVKL